VTEYWRELHNYEIHNLLRNQIKAVKMLGESKLRGRNE